MVTNISINTVESTAVVYLQDGSHIVVEPFSDKYLQLPDNAFCTISEASEPVSPEDGEHPPQAPPQWFIDSMIKFWTTFQEKLTGNPPEAPEVTPH